MKTLFIGGSIYAGGPTSVRGGVVVSDGFIVAVGPDDQVRDAAGADATVIDLNGGLLSAGFIDAHVHPVIGGAGLGACDLTGADGLDGALNRVREYSQTHPDLPWIQGGGWLMEWFPDGAPSRSLLDAVVPERPVILTNSDLHGCWVNSRALEVADITRSTPDPVGGRIVRDSYGEPTGALHEEAAQLMRRLAPQPTRTDQIAALLRGQDHLLSLGITGWQDALVGVRPDGTDLLDAYIEATESKELKVRATAALWWDRDRGIEQIDDLLARRRRARDSGFRAETVKIMLDGVVETKTAALSAPYRDTCGHETDNSGITFIDPPLLQDIVSALDALDFQVHFHSLGDQAVTDALDSVQAAQSRNGARGNRHHLAHLQIVSDADIPRFAELAATANIQPLWATNEPQMTEMSLPFLPPALRARQYPFGDLAAAGAHLCGGSDWPVSSAAPLDGIHVAVNRSFDDGIGAYEPFLPEQRISVAQAWTAYTEGSAWVNRSEESSGTLRAGYAADLVVLDRDPFAIPPSEIAATQVVSTWVAGECEYRR